MSDNSQSLDVGWDLMHKFVKKRVNCVPGMSQFINTMKTHPGGEWAKLADVDWSSDLAPVTAWFCNAVTQSKPSRSIRGLWFTVPQIDLGSKHISWLGSKEFDPSGETNDWAIGLTWPSNDLNSTTTTNLLCMEAAAKHLGFANRNNEAALSSNSLLKYLLPLAYCGLLMREVLDALPAGSFPSPNGFGATVGFDDGDWLLVRKPISTRNTKKK